MGHKQDRITRLEEQVRDLQRQNLAMRQEKNIAVRDRDKVVAATLAFAAAMLGKPADKLNVDSLLESLRRTLGDSEPGHPATVPAAATDAPASQPADGQPDQNRFSCAGQPAEKELTLKDVYDLEEKHGCAVGNVHHCGQPVTAEAACAATEATGARAAEAGVPAVETPHPQDVPVLDGADGKTP